MPITPEKSLSICPAMKLIAEEKLELAKYEGMIDHELSTNWIGLVMNFKIEAASMRLIGHLVRRYMAYGWLVTYQAQDGSMAKAADLLHAGQGCDWVVSFNPRWSRSDIVP